MVEPISAWEYRIDFGLPVESLAELGTHGWELVQTNGSTFILKRPAQSFVERVTLEQRARYYTSLGLDPDGAQ